MFDYKKILEDKSYIRKQKYSPATTAATAAAPVSRSEDPPTLDSETGWTGELWSTTNPSKWQN